VKDCEKKLAANEREPQELPKLEQSKSTAEVRVIAVIARDRTRSEEPNLTTRQRGEKQKNLPQIHGTHGKPGQAPGQVDAEKRRSGIARRTWPEVVSSPPQRWTRKQAQCP
jgi:hypothetical protein